MGALGSGGGWGPRASRIVRAPRIPELAPKLRPSRAARYGMVPKVIEGKLPKARFMPAMMRRDGTVHVGEAGEIHANIYQRVFQRKQETSDEFWGQGRQFQLQGKSIDGFVDRHGLFYTRESIDAMYGTFAGETYALEKRGLLNED